MQSASECLHWKPSSAVEDSERGHKHLAGSPLPISDAPFYSFHSAIVPCTVLTDHSLSPLHSEVHFPLPHGEGRVPPPYRSQLPIHPLDIGASPASICTIEVLWWLFIIPVVVLDLKIYGQWFTKEKMFLSMVANPTRQISATDNMVGAWTAAKMDWEECSVCIFTIGVAHYLVVFFTLHQRLSGSNRLPAPLFFLFVAPPSMASLAWNSISGRFDTPCKMLLSPPLSLHIFMTFNFKVQLHINTNTRNA